MWNTVVWLGLLVLPTGVHGFPCPGLCSSRGLCLDQGVCLCPNNWAGADCSVAVCPMGRAWADQVTGTDQGHNLAPCSNRGTCDTFGGSCICEAGFTGAACERMSCNCNGHGRCESMRQYAMLKDPGIGPVYTYTSVWDSDQVYGCVCDPGYAGPSCSERLCPRGDDPLTGTIQDPDGIQRNERQRVNCRAAGGSFTLTFRGHTTEAILSIDPVTEVKRKLEMVPSIQAVTVTFGGITQVACTAIGNDISIEFTQDFGDLPDITGSAAGLSSTPSIQAALTIATMTHGTKESVPCSRRGTCDPSTGFCTCYPGFGTSDGRGAIGTRGDCGYMSSTVTRCPGEIACSGHGTCRGPPTYDCICSQGYIGGDCNERECPIGKAWFDLPVDTDTAHQLVECSNAGSCDRTKGDCVCLPGFTGDACNRLTCPRDCSGHGTCQTQEELAKSAQLNGERMGWTYGAAPNKKETWDFDMVRGCLCNAGWEGHDCSKQSCPRGDDPMTRVGPDGRFQQNEIQVLKCQGSSGFFSLQFRDEVTPQLPFTVNAPMLQSILNQLPSLGEVRVTFSEGETAAACSAAGANAITIEFLQDFGDLPPLRWIIDGALTMTVDVDGSNGSQRGTKENAICSNRGLCNYATGTCKCVFGFTSSDGYGHEGDRGDCGHKDLIYINSAGRLANES